jgi:hypothetical protein
MKHRGLRDELHLIVRRMAFKCFVDPVLNMSEAPKP